MIQLSYSDLLDILDDYRSNTWESKPCSVETFAKYIWDQYRQNEEKPRRLPEQYEPEWDNPLVL